MQPVSTLPVSATAIHDNTAMRVIPVSERMQSMAAAAPGPAPEPEPIEAPYDPMKVMFPLFVEFLFYGEEEETGNPAMQTVL